MQNLIPQIQSAIAAHDGASINKQGENPKHGFMVALAGSEVILTGKPSDAQILDYLAEHDPGHDYFGAWVNDGQTYFDVSVNVADESTARKIGQENHQLSIYDVENQRVIWL